MLILSNANVIVELHSHLSKRLAKWVMTTTTATTTTNRRQQKTVPRAAKAYGRQLKTLKILGVEAPLAPALTEL